MSTKRYMYLSAFARPPIQPVNLPAHRIATHPHQSPNCFNVFLRTSPRLALASRYSSMLILLFVHIRLHQAFCPLQGQKFSGETVKDGLHPYSIPPFSIPIMQHRLHISKLPLTQKLRQTTHSALFCTYQAKVYPFTLAVSQLCFKKKKR